MLVSNTMSVGLRERKKAHTRRTLQHEALRLFAARGYEATSVEDIAAAAGVSSMTFFRYFPSKEDVVLEDDYDALLAAQLAEQPAHLPALVRVQSAVRASLSSIYAEARDELLTRVRLITSTPALRARLYSSQSSTERLLAEVFSAEDPAHPGVALRGRVIGAACIATLTTALLTWAERNGAEHLPDLVDRAFTILRTEVG